MRSVPALVAGALEAACGSASTLTESLADGSVCRAGAEVGCRAPILDRKLAVTRDGGTARDHLSICMRKSMLLFADELPSSHA